MKKHEDNGKRCKKGNTDEVTEITGDGNLFLEAEKEAKQPVQGENPKCAADEGIGL